MKKIFILFIVQNLFQQFCFSQADSSTTKTYHKMVISISGGTAIPVGVFAKFENDYTPYIFQGGNIAGGASIGYFGKLDFSYLIHKHFGAIAMLYTTVNNGKELSSQEMKPPISYAMGGGFASTSYTNDTKKWLTNGALIGVFAESGNKFILVDFRICLGVQQVKSPEAHIYNKGFIWKYGSGTTGYYLNVETQPSMTSYNIVGNIGIDTRLSISNKIKAKVGIENFFSQALFKGNLTYTTDINYINGTNYHSENQKEVSFRKNILLFCLSVGVSYEIK